MKLNSESLQDKLKRDFVMDRLYEKGIKLSSKGVPIHYLNYQQLKHELVMQRIKNE